jgi:hypothetical protein
MMEMFSWTHFMGEKCTMANGPIHGKMDDGNGPTSPTHEKNA